MSRRRVRNKRQNRRGAILVLVIVSIIALVACAALAIDLGLMMAARTQCVAAADAASMAGTRALNSAPTSVNNNYAAALPSAQLAATQNKILGTSITNSQVTVNIGRYVYNSATQRFEGQFPGPSTENWSLVQATVSVPITSSLAFSKVLNFMPANIQATSTSAHRPRDVAIILDFSGSMQFQSLAGGYYDGTNYCNNPDTSVPRFGHYSSLGAGTLWATSFTAPYDAANTTTTTSDGRPPIVQDFYQNSAGTPAWSAASAGYGTTPGGDRPLTTNKNASSTYAQTAAQVLNIGSPGTSTRDATFESQGYAAYGMDTSFNAYTQGPAYWGKTFFIWPPNPINDWRKKYFYYYGTTTQLDDNSLLWDSSGNWQAPGSGNYSINYNAILTFIKSTGPNPFPNTLRSGRISYYTKIPSSISLASNPPTDPDERFWKEYIDYVLGVVDTGGSYYAVSTGSWGATGYGPDFTWGTVKITPKASLTGSPKPYMHYADNPMRPITKFWFGPQSMIDFLENFTIGYQNNGHNIWWPGTCHEAPLYACKLGVQAALSDVQKNHPNDLVSLIFFSDPKTSAN